MYVKNSDLLETLVLPLHPIGTASGLNSPDEMLLKYLVFRCCKLTRDTLTGFIVGFVTFLLILIFECRPTRAYWLYLDPAWIVAGHKYICADFEGIVLPLYSALSVLGDFYSTTLPLCLVYSLQMGRRQKISLYFLFGVGFLVVAAGILRTIFVDFLVNKTYDTTWTYVDSTIWVTIELYVSIFCASVPSLKPFVKKFFIEPITQQSSSPNRRRSGYTFGSSGKKHNHVRDPSDTYLNSSTNDEETWTRDGVAVELSDFGQQDKNQKAEVTIQETGEYFNDRPRHSLIPNETRAGFERYQRRQHSASETQSRQRQRTQQNPNNQHEHPHRRTLSQNATHNTADRNNHDSEEPILEVSQILARRKFPHPGELVPLIMYNPPPEPLSRAYTPNSRNPSFVTISAFPMPQGRTPLRISETDEREFEPPLQGT